MTVTESVYTGPEVTGRFTTEAETGELQADVTIQSLSALSWSDVNQYLADSEAANEDSIMTDARRSMLEIIDASRITMLPFPSSYQDVRDLDDMVSRTVARMLELLDIEIEIDEWTGISP